MVGNFNVTFNCGLFFEMNYLVGVILAIYITWFVVAIPALTIPTELDENGTIKLSVCKCKLFQHNMVHVLANMDIRLSVMNQGV
jgi:hypothetical protein